jgi:tRNA threonylcarbamoyladenosine biosynthesis protein TsaB
VIVLAIDTCLNACSVALVDGERVLAYRREAMARGHQERLAPMAQAVMADAGLSMSAIARVAVTVGPGSFTGLRVGIAFAKGLGSALGVPVVGVGSLEALAAEAEGPAAGAIDARRDQVYLQLPGSDPEVLPLAEARARLAAQPPLSLVGSGATLLARDGDRVHTPEGCDARLVARIGAARQPQPLTPLYLRAPDAKLPA